MNNSLIENLNNRFNRWVASHYLRLAVFNLIIVLLVLLRSAGYFEPFFPLSINFIVFVSLFLSIFLLDTKSWVFFLFSITFWVLASFFKIILKVDVWAERAALYTFEALVFGIVLLIIENINLFKGSKAGRHD